jgi:hypothetical protein
MPLLLSLVKYLLQDAGDSIFVGYQAGLNDDASANRMLVLGIKHCGKYYRFNWLIRFSSVIATAAAGLIIPLMGIEHYTNNKTGIS